MRIEFQVKLRINSLIQGGSLMKTSNDTLLDLLNIITAEVKSMHKRIEHTDVKSKEEAEAYITIINKLIRELDHTVEKLESIQK